MALKQRPLLPLPLPERRPKRGICPATFVNGNKYHAKPLEDDQKNGNKNGEAQMESSFGFNAVTEARNADRVSEKELDIEIFLSLYPLSIKQKGIITLRRLSVCVYENLDLRDYNQICCQ